MIMFYVTDRQTDTRASAHIHTQLFSCLCVIYAAPDDDFKKLLKHRHKCFKSVSSK